MKKTRYALALLVAIATGFAGCSKDSDTVTLTSACYVSAFQMTAVKRVVKTTSQAGEDSLYYTTTNATAMRMRIDHREGTITNVDLLPAGSLLDKVLVSVTAQGSVAYAPEADTTSWTVFQSTDSIDFTAPVLFRIVANDGHGYRDYKVTLRARENNASEYTWTRIGAVEGLADKRRAKLLFHETVGMDAGAYALLFCNDADGGVYVGLPSGAHEIAPLPTGWNIQPCEGLATADVNTVVSYRNRLWISDDEGRLYNSESGISWQQVAEDGTTEPVCLFAASPTALYALVGEQQEVATSEDGLTWQSMTVEGTVCNGPAVGLAYAQTNGNRRVLLMADTQADATAEGNLTLWSLLEGSGEGWFRFNDATSEFPLPRWQHPVLTTYNNWLVAMGDTDVSGAHTPLDAIYISHDNGINWKTDAYLKAPSEIAGKSGVIAAAGWKEYIWIIANGQFWALRYNGYDE